MAAGMRQSDRAFGLTFAAFLAIAASMIWLIFDNRLDGLYIAAAAFVVLALVVPWVLLPLNRLWQRFVHRLGQVNNVLVLGLFFWVVVVPTGLLLRLFGRDPMQRAFKRDSESYLTPVGRQANAETFRDMF